MLSGALHRGACFPPRLTLALPRAGTSHSVSLLADEWLTLGCPTSLNGVCFEWEQGYIPGLKDIPGLKERSLVNLSCVGSADPSFLHNPDKLWDPHILALSGLVKLTGNLQVGGQDSKNSPLPLISPEI